MSEQEQSEADAARLREQQGDPDADVAYAARLVSAARLRETSDDQADRVWRRLAAAGATSSASATSGRRRAPAPWLRPVMAGFAVVGMASLAYAGATVGRRLVAEWRAARAADAPAEAAGDKVGRRGGPARSEASAPVPSAAPVPLPPPLPTAAVDTNPAAPAPGTGAAAGRPRIHALPDPAVAVNTALDAESESVKGAVRALRRDADYERARLYLRYYMARFPEGVFHEEALALSVEAAEKAGDLAEAGTLASRYLARYPEGRYRANTARVARKAGVGVRK